MKIDSYSTSQLQGVTNQQNSTTKSGSFEDTLKNVSLKTSSTQDSKITNLDIQSFKDNLTSMGASAFWLQFNLQKIAEEVEKKREELMKAFDEQSKNMTQDQKDTALADIEKILEEYAKKLLAQAKERSEEQANNKKDKKTLIQTLLSERGVYN